MFFQENIDIQIQKRDSEENSLMTNLFSLKLPSYYLLCSKTVGKVSKVMLFSEDNCLRKDDCLCFINFLELEYKVSMENDGYLKKCYIKEGITIEYNFPLFLFEYKEW